MAAKASKRTVPDTYFDLVRAFPLRHIGNGAELAAAIEKLDQLLQVNLDEGGTQYLDALTDLVESYEDRHEPRGDVSATDMLRGLMTANRLTQQELARKVGIAQSTISAVLNNTRQMKVVHMQALGDYFGIDAAAFMPNG